MADSFRFFRILFCNVLLIIIIQLSNNALSAYSISLYVYILLIIYPGLKMSLRSGLLCVGLTGLVIDASNQVLYGCMSLCLCVFFVGLYCFRCHFEAFLSNNLVVVVQIFNLLLTLTLGITYAGDYLYNVTYWSSLFISVAISQIILLVTHSWFYELQRSLEKVSNIDYVEDIQAHE